MRKQFLLLILMGFLIGGCAAKEKPQMMITMIGDIGGLTDQSFNQSIWEGLIRLSGEKPDISVNYFISKDGTDYADLIRQAASQPGAFLVLAASYRMADAVKEVSKEFPRINFVILDNTSSTEGLNNVTSLLFNEQEGTYLAGYLAAKMSKTKKIGFLGGGGGSAPVIEKFRYGFQLGAQRADPNIQIISDYIDSFFNLEEARVVAQRLVNQGVDVLFPVAGHAGVGAIGVAKEKNIYVIGVDRDQSSLAPNQMLTSVLKRVDVAAADVSQRFLDGNHPPAQLVLGLREHAVGLAPVNRNIVTDEKVLKELSKIEDNIVSGKIKISQN